MDTNPPKSVRPGSVRGPYRRHSLAFKRAVVELTLRPGGSVARIAREHDLNTNQLFDWRRAYQDGLRDEPVIPALLAVESMSALLAETADREPTAPEQTSDGVLVIESRQGRLCVKGARKHLWQRRIRFVPHDPQSDKAFGTRAPFGLRGAVRHLPSIPLDLLQEIGRGKIKNNHRSVRDLGGSLAVSVEASV